MTTLIFVIVWVVRIYSYIIIADALVLFFIPPFNPIRSFLDRLVSPLLNPIRRILPTLGGFDFSPIVLILILQLVESLLLGLLRL